MAAKITKATKFSAKAVRKESDEFQRIINAHLTDEDAARMER